MKVLLINGSPHRDGNTFTALSEAAKALEAQGIVTEIAWIGNRPVRGCIACGSCRVKGNGICRFDDDICNEMIGKMNESDGLIVGSPTYYGQPTGMPIVTSQYWNIAYGRVPGQAAEDSEGMQTMRTLANNMAWMLKSLHREDAPEREPWQPMHFIR